MPIELDDPDERDGRHPWRRRVAVGAAVLAAAGVGAGAVIVMQDDQDPVAESADSTPDISVPPTEPDEPVEPVGPRPPDAFPDFGSDFVGAPLEILYERTTETGIRVVLQDLGAWNNFGGRWGGVEELDAVAFEGVALEGAGADRAVPNTVPGTLPADSNREPEPEGTVPGGNEFEPEPVPGGGWQPPGWCFASGGFRLAMTYKDAVSTAQGQWYTELRDAIKVSMFSGGQADGRPFRVLTVQALDTISSVAVEWADGATDVAEPVAGWAVLAAPGQADGRFTLVVVDDGIERELGWQDLIEQEGDADWVRECNPPPPELPAPGVQPDDPAEAEAQIRDRFAQLVDFNVAPEDKPDDLIDDPTGVDAAVQQVRDGGFAATAATAEYVINEVVFTSPTEAWFQYDLFTDTVDFPGRFGIAYFIDGEWRISRRVICQDLALAGAQCEPFAEPIVPVG